LVGCAKFTDINPKGKNLLNTAEHLDMLLNHDYQQFSTIATTGLVNGAIYFTNLVALKAEPIKTTNYARIYWDESVDRVALANTDNLYEALYRIIGRICNPVIAQADAASGNRNLADRCKAEAYVLRAWFHYIAVNVYAKAYNPATAATDGGVAYLLENELTDMVTASKKLTVEQVYKHILEDLDRAFELNALHNVGLTGMRASKSFAYAVQAQAFMSMHRYNDAKMAAGKSLEINNHVDNHNQSLNEYPSLIPGLLPEPTLFWRPNFSSREDLFAIFTGSIFNGIPAETMAMLDPNSVLLNYMPTGGKMGYAMLGMDLGEMFFGVPLEVWFGNYDQATFSGIGITTVDMHLIEAECLMRSNDLDGAKAKIEHIREHRIETGKYEPATASTKAEVFELLKRVWRSDNFMTYRDYINLKRWNTDPEFAAPLTRTLLGETYTLRPDSPLWIFPFPQTATNFNPNLTQNY
jgi:tetratricopeptide (TPR) repeat protein